MENAGLSFSWDSENQQERVPVIRPGGGQAPERAGIHPGLHTWVCATRTSHRSASGHVAHPPARAASREAPSGAACGDSLPRLQGTRGARPLRPAHPTPTRGLRQSICACERTEWPHLSHSCCEAQTSASEGALRTHRGNASGGGGEGRVWPSHTAPLPGSQEGLTLCPPCATGRFVFVFAFWGKTVYLGFLVSGHGTDSTDSVSHG